MKPIDLHVKEFLTALAVTIRDVNGDEEKQRFMAHLGTTVDTMCSGSISQYDSQELQSLYAYFLRVLESPYDHLM